MIIFTEGKKVFKDKIVLEVYIPFFDILDINHGVSQFLFSWTQYDNE